MKSRPILFSAPMVRALLAGTKSQTRRALKQQPIDILPLRGKKRGVEWVTLEQREPEARGRMVRCRYGVPGDLLWVRETWCPSAPATFYRASAEALPAGGRWHPSIHMPRWASRITLRITNVRIQRLHELSVRDAMAEGIFKVGKRWEAEGICATPVGPIDCYRAVWEYVNGRGSWALNPWVWALTFERV